MTLLAQTSAPQRHPQLDGHLHAHCRRCWAHLRLMASPWVKSSLAGLTAPRAAAWGPSMFDGRWLFGGDR